MSPWEDVQARLTGLCVLVVEDDGYIALEMEAALTDYGARIVGPISTLAAASTLISREHIDVAMLDIALAEGWVYPSQPSNPIRARTGDEPRPSPRPSGSDRSG